MGTRGKMGAHPVVCDGESQRKATMMGNQEGRLHDGVWPEG